MQMSVEQVLERMAEKGRETGVPHKKYVDLEFLPSDISVYNHVAMDRPLDVVIHWRRPEEFLDPNSDINSISDRFGTGTGNKKSLAQARDLDNRLKKYT